MKPLLRHRSILRKNVVRSISTIILATVVASQAACGSDSDRELKRQDLSIIKPDKCPGGWCGGGGFETLKHKDGKKD
jgi:hypothetical protein